MITEAIKIAVEGTDLPFDVATDAMNSIMSGESTDAQIASLITALRMKGETAIEIAAFAKVMREKAVVINTKSTNLLDTCGTGGDCQNSFNISTTVALVAAACGVKVAKHGNRCVSSKCGSADVLEKLGVNIEIDCNRVAQCIDEVGIGFLFAPACHQAMKYAIGPRKEIGIRTIFNILGPLTNPAHAKYQLLGVYSPDLVEPVANALNKLGVKKAIVVHGNGYDELTVTGDSFIAILENNIITTQTINPKDFGINICKPDDLLGATPDENALIIKNILSGRQTSAKSDAVILNSAAALLAAENVKDIAEGINRVKDILNKGTALTKLDELVSFTNK